MSTDLTEEWSARLAACPVSKQTMNRLVMDFLVVVEGHKEAAECFQSESGTPAGLDLETISDRRTIRSAIEAGDVERAVEHARRMNPELLESTPELAFHVNLQRLVELIRASRVEEALAFARGHLAPMAEQSAKLLAELERAMLLLAYADLSACPEAELLSQTQRQRTASLLNSAVLSAQAQEKEAALPMLFRRLLWEQEDLQHRQRVRHPRIDNFDEALPRLPSEDDDGSGPLRDQVHQWAGGGGDANDAVDSAAVASERMRRADEVLAWNRQE